MEIASHTTVGRKRKFEDRPNEHHLKAPKLPDGGAGKLEGNTVDKTEDIYPTILPSLSRSSAAETKQARRAKSYLCKRCSKINLDALLSRSHKTQVGQPASLLAPVRGWDINFCLLCSLFHSTIDATYWESERLELRSFSSNKMEDKTWCSISTNLLQAGYGARYIVSQPEGITGPVNLIKENIDRFDAVKKWIDFCQSQHTKVCSIEDQFSISGLKLIDCYTRTVVPGDDYQYVALSYVWGPSSEASEDPTKLPEELPDTIKDAISVTKKVGYRYIWIDRYCIDQKNEQEIADQVGKMDLIYQNAELTIIAAIGEDPSYGLPGVGRRKRGPEHLTTCAKVGKHFLISTDAEPKSATANTKWKTRAWTYQEALLSRRRLVFSREQMYFECYGMYCCESLDFPLKSLHRKDMQGFKSVFCSENRVGIFPKGVGTTPIDIIRRIEEYSKLNLTNSSDILKGMLGIFNAFQRSPMCLHHFAGIPILPSMPMKCLRKPVEDWTRSVGFFLGLFWDLETRSERRDGFPSWCWTGWHGHVKWDKFPWPSVNVDPNIEVTVKFADGRILTIDSFQDLDSQSSLYAQLSATICIAAWTIEVRILRHVGESNQKDKASYEARLMLNGGGFWDWTFKSTSKRQLMPGKVCKGIILGYDPGDIDNVTTLTGPAILVCDKVGDRMERIGLDWANKVEHVSWDWSVPEEEFIQRMPPVPKRERLDLVKSWEEVQLG